MAGTRAAGCALFAGNKAATGTDVYKRQLTQRVFDYFMESTARKFVFFSSVKAAADSVVGDMLTEDVIPAPIGPYGESKIADVYKRQG